MPPHNPIPVRLTLVSASPRRQELLRGAGFVFDVHPSHAAEIWSAGDPVQLARVNAERKVRKSDFFGARDRLLIGADTIVALDRHVFGKPAGRESAQRMLETLSRKTHRVITGLCLSGPVPDSDLPPTICDADISFVTFNLLPAATITAYLDTGEWKGKAGAYAIQAHGRGLVADYSGAFDNIVGLPLTLLNGLLTKHFGHCILQS